MTIAVPMLVDPVNSQVLDLPFVNANAGFQCCDIIRQAFHAAEEQSGNETRTEHIVLLHLYTKSGPVLLEMIVNIVTSESERHAVLIGREVNPDLATLMASEGNVSGAGSSASWASDRGFAPGLMMTNIPSTTSPSPLMMIPKFEPGSLIAVSVSPSLIAASSNSIGGNSLMAASSNSIGGNSLMAASSDSIGGNNAGSEDSSSLPGLVSLASSEDGDSHRSRASSQDGGSSNKATTTLKTAEKAQELIMIQHKTKS
jgi:hypothetical protein